MKTYIALLRGINVGGHKKILMKDLRSMLESAGLKGVQTYIQSGNVIFHSNAKASDIERLITENIKKAYGWELPVIVKTHSEIQEILDRCPFSEEKIANSYFVIFSKTPAEECIKELQLPGDTAEEIFITETCIYLWSENYARTKFNNNFFERKLKVGTTSRNYRTLMKLIDLSS